jgi:lipopolysaccharide/colanic/teichoic acid biosynthesis glycosyltransferase
MSTSGRHASRDPVPPAEAILDRLVSGTLLLLLSLAIVVVVSAMAIEMTIVARDRGPFLYREPRVSRGRAFQLLKFRTLRREVAAGGHARLREADAANLTWAGRRILKPWYLDELPQLVNVLRGDISLVGPRPWPPQLVERQVEAADVEHVRVHDTCSGAPGMGKQRATQAAETGRSRACRERDDSA